MKFPEFIAVCATFGLGAVCFWPEQEVAVPTPAPIYTEQPPAPEVAPPEDPKPTTVEPPAAPVAKTEPKKVEQPKGHWETRSYGWRGRRTQQVWVLDK